MSKEAEKVAAQWKADTKMAHELAEKIFEAMGDAHMRIAIPACCFVLAEMGVDLARDGWDKEDYVDHVSGGVECAYETIVEALKHAKTH